MKKILTLIAAAMAVVTLTVNMNLVNADANDEMKEASCVSFVIPSQFEPGLERGLFVNKQYPMESSTIQYDCYNNGKDELLTNKEKQALAEKDEPVISDESLRLSKEIFEDARPSVFALLEKYKVQAKDNNENMAKLPKKDRGEISR